MKAYRMGMMLLTAVLAAVFMVATAGISPAPQAVFAQDPTEEPTPDPDDPSGEGFELDGTFYVQGDGMAMIFNYPADWIDVSEFDQVILVNRQSVVDKMDESEVTLENDEQLIGFLATMEAESMGSLEDLLETFTLEVTMETPGGEAGQLETLTLGDKEVLKVAFFTASFSGALYGFESNGQYILMVALAGEWGALEPTADAVVASVRVTTAPQVDLPETFSVTSEGITLTMNYPAGWIDATEESASPLLLSGESVYEKFLSGEQLSALESDESVIAFVPGERLENIDSPEAYMDSLVEDFAADMPNPEFGPQQRLLLDGESFIRVELTTDGYAGALYGFEVGEYYVVMIAISGDWNVFETTANAVAGSISASITVE